MHVGPHMVRCWHLEAALSTVMSVPLKCVTDFCF